jgi:hypothetical protein
MSPNTTTIGNCKVYRAKDVYRGREVALTFLPKEVVADPARREACQRQARLAARVRDNYVLTIYECDQVNGSWFLTLEMVDGPNLFEHVTGKGALPAEEARALILQAARALAQAEKQGLPVAALSPAGFLVANQSGRVVLKLLPVDMLREPGNGAAQPGKPGDFLAPEEARGGPRDVRCAIYSLGATFYFLLTGRPPGPREAEAWAAIQGRVPAPLTSVLQRMLARDPEDRYPTPEALIQDLERVGGRTAAKAGIQAGGAGLLSRLAAKAKAAPGRLRRPAPGKATQRLAPGPRPRRVSRLLLLGSLTCLVALTLVVIIWATRPSGDGDAKASDNGNKPGEIKPGEGQGGGPGEGDGSGGGLAPTQEIQWLYPGAVGLDPAELYREFTAPWAGDKRPADDLPVLHVSRLPLPEKADGKSKGPVFSSLAAACAAAAPGKTTIIEIHDNGPLFEPPIHVADRNLIVRPDGNHRPILAWDLGKARASFKALGQGKRSALLTVENGDLALLYVDVDLDWSNDDGGAVSLVRVAGGDFRAEFCTFSVAGNNKAGVTALRFEAAEGSGKKCRLSSCFTRGANLTALEMLAPGADALLWNCLLVGGSQPLLRVQAGSSEGKTSTLRALRSTLVAEQILMQVLATGDAPPALRWMGCDSLLARSGKEKEPGGVMVALPGTAKTSAMRWEPYNCLYAGWKKLLSGHESIERIEDWQQRWKLSEGDAIEPRPWETLVGADPFDLPSFSFATTTPPVESPPPYAYRALGGGVSKVLGCDLPQLGLRPNWLPWAYRGFAVFQDEVLKDGTPPKIETGSDNLYRGGTIDASKTDLGKFLRSLQNKKQLAPEVHIRLTGSGEQKTSPVFLENTWLWLYFDPPANGEKPLVLVPADEAGPVQKALFQINGGQAWIVNGDIRLPEGKSARLPHYLILVHDGTLKLHHTRLQGPLADPADSYWGLIDIEGSRLFEFVSLMTAHESVLVTANVALHVHGSGARLRLQQSVIVAGADALHFRPGFREAGENRLNVECTLENCTVAARQAVAYAQDVPPPWIAEPVILQTRSNVFLNPFEGTDGKPAPAGAFLYRGEALPRGVVAWQGSGDVFDKRLHTYVWHAGKDGKAARAEQAQTFAVFERVFGPVGSGGAVLDVPLTRTLRLDRLALEELVLPAGAPEQKGADLRKLGILK